MIELLFVEDDKRAISHARQRVEDQHDDVNCEVKHFDEATDWIARNPPDIISLDLMNDGLSGEATVAGQAMYEQIWKDYFCPVIIYSAQTDAKEESRPPHPFLATIQKGSGSPAKFAKAVNEFRPHVEAIRNAKTQVRREFAVAMQTVAPFVFDNVTDKAERVRLVTRSGRRRLAALMDDFTDHGNEGETQLLASWEHYLCPPVGPDLLLGDLLREQGTDSHDPEGYRVILTPSCDLVARGGRKPKVANVLVAKCLTMKAALSAVGIPLGKKTLKDEEKLLAYKDSLKKSMLSQSFFRNIFPFPPFANVLPAMAADLKQLDLIPFGEVQTEYERVCSLDSPFREVVSWAYMQTGCRPALPDRELDQWVDEIVASHS